MNVLVTGGGGFLGSYLARDLVAAGHRVTSFSRGDYPALRALGVNTIAGDLADPMAVDAAVAGMDVVFHTAAKVDLSGSYHAFRRANVRGTRNVIAAARRYGVRKLVYTSSPSVVFGKGDIQNGDESLPYPSEFSTFYQRTKAEAEQMVILAHRPGRLSTTALRVHAVWGVGDNHLLPRILRMAKSGGLRIVGTGRNRVSLTHVRNASRAHLQAAASERAGGQIYFINDPEPVILWDWLNALLARLGLSPVRKRVSFGAAFALGWLLEQTRRVFPSLGEPRVTRYSASLLAKDHYFSTEKAARDFGYAPQVTQGEGLDELVAHYLRG
jgi:nucleoside-diphosphate-sugar epimerase